MSSSREILTIGHSTHEAEDFVGLLQAHGVEVLVDVRRHPGSRRVPWTNSQALEQRLRGAGVSYLHLEGLGGRRRPKPESRNDGWRVAQFQGYADHMSSEEFLHGLKRLEGLARKQRAAVMCAEAQWWRCHRRLLADALVVNGWRVLHIDDRADLQEHSLTEFAEVEEGSLRYPSSIGADPRRRGSREHGP